MTATPPANLARRSCNFSRSKSDVVSEICFLRRSTRSVKASFDPAPSTMVVESLVTVTLAACPSCAIVASFKFKPKSSVITVPPVRIAISCNCSLRRSPKPGALTATTLKVPRILFKTSVGKASPVISSAIINNERPCSTTPCSKGKMS